MMTHLGREECFQLGGGSAEQHRQRPQARVGGDENLRR